MSKGSNPRPIPDRSRYEANWDAMDWSARLKDCTPVPQYPTEGTEVDPNHSPDWHSKGL